MKHCITIPRTSRTSSELIAKRKISFQMKLDPNLHDMTERRKNILRWNKGLYTRSFSK